MAVDEATEKKRLGARIQEFTRKVPAGVTAGGLRQTQKFLETLKKAQKAKSLTDLQIAVRNLESF